MYYIHVLGTPRNSSEVEILHDLCHYVLLWILIYSIHQQVRTLQMMVNIDIFAQNRLNLFPFLKLKISTIAGESHIKSQFSHFDILINITHDKFSEFPLRRVNIVIYLGLRFGYLVALHSPRNLINSLLYNGLKCLLAHITLSP